MAPPLSSAKRRAFARQIARTYPSLTFKAFAVVTRRRAKIRSSTLALQTIPLGGSTSMGVHGARQRLVRIVSSLGQTRQVRVALDARHQRV